MRFRHKDCIKKNLCSKNDKKKKKKEEKQQQQQQKQQPTQPFHNNEQAKELSEPEQSDSDNSETSTEDQTLPVRYYSQEEIEDLKNLAEEEVRKHYLNYKIRTGVHTSKKFIEKQIKEKREELERDLIRLSRKALMADTEMETASAETASEADE